MGLENRYRIAAELKKSIAEVATEKKIERKIVNLVLEDLLNDIGIIKAIFYGQVYVQTEPVEDERKWYYYVRMAMNALSSGNRADAAQHYRLAAEAQLAKVKKECKQRGLSLEKIATDSEKFESFDFCEVVDKIQKVAESSIESVSQGEEVMDRITSMMSQSREGLLRNDYKAYQGLAQIAENSEAVFDLFYAGVERLKSRPDYLDILAQSRQEILAGDAEVTEALSKVEKRFKPFKKIKSVRKLRRQIEDIRDTTNHEAKVETPVDWKKVQKDMA